MDMALDVVVVVLLCVGFVNFMRLCGCSDNSAYRHTLSLIAPAGFLAFCALLLIMRDEWFAQAVAPYVLSLKIAMSLYVFLAPIIGERLARADNT